MANPVVEVLGVTRVFPPRHRSTPPVTALRSLSFTAPPGAVLAITGANGAGKTTVLDIIATLLLPTTGDVRVAGVSVVQRPAEVRRHVAYCPAGSASFWPRLTGRENLHCFSALAGLGAHARPSRLAEAVSRVGLSDAVLGREVRTYSDGEVQRLNLARALMRDVAVWLLDEPTRSLDPDAQSSIWAIIREVARDRGLCVVAATHDMVRVSTDVDAVVRL